MKNNFATRICGGILAGTMLFATPALAAEDLSVSDSASTATTATSFEDVVQQFETTVTNMEGSWDLTLENTADSVRISYDRAPLSSGSEYYPMICLVCRVPGNTFGCTQVLLGSEALDVETAAGRIVLVDRDRQNGQKYEYRVVRSESTLTYTASNIASIIWLKRPGITSLTGTGNGTLRVKWKKNSKADGYKIYYSRSKNMSNAKSKTVLSADTTSTTLTGLTSGKKYYVRVQSYVTDDGITSYSAKSPVKSLRVPS